MVATHPSLQSYLFKLKMSEPKLIWDITLSDALNIHVLKPKVIDLAICMGRVFARDDFGLAYEVVSDAEFLVLTCWTRRYDSSRSGTCPWSRSCVDELEEGRRYEDT